MSPARRTSGPSLRPRSKGVTSKPRPFPARASSLSRRGDSTERMWDLVLRDVGYTVEHVFPIGTDPDMHGVNYIVVGMSLDPKLRDRGMAYATWLGIDWTHHPNVKSRDRGCVLQYGHYRLTETEAFADALERVEDHRGHFRWDPVPGGSSKSGRSRR